MLSDSHAEARPCLPKMHAGQTLAAPTEAGRIGGYWSNRPDSQDFASKQVALKTLGAAYKEASHLSAPLCTASCRFPSPNNQQVSSQTPQGSGPGKRLLLRHTTRLQTLQPGACRQPELKTFTREPGSPVIPAPSLSLLQEERACCHSCFANVGIRPCRSNVPGHPCSATFCKRYALLPVMGHGAVASAYPWMATLHPETQRPPPPPLCRLWGVRSTGPLAVLCVHPKTCSSLQGVLSAPVQ